MKQKKAYNGLLTARRAVASGPILASSTARIKVKTESSTTPWVEDDDAGTLTTTITSQPLS